MTAERDDYRIRTNDPPVRENSARLSVPNVQILDGLAVTEGHSKPGSGFLKSIGELEAITGFIVWSSEPADNAIASMMQCRLDPDTTVAIKDLIGNVVC